MASSWGLAMLKELDDLNKLEKEVNQALQSASKGSLIPPKPISLASLTLPQTPLAEKATAYAKSCLDSAVFLHSMRSYYFGTAIATVNFAHWNWDPEAFYLASVLHDLGLSSVAMEQTPLSFEFHGGLLARDFLLREGAPARVSDSVAEAIFRHRDNICETFGHSPESALLILGTHLDVYGAFNPLIHADTVQEVVNGFPRNNFCNVFADLIIQEIKIKRFCTAAGRVDDSGFFSKIRNNAVFAKYDHQSL
jgi:cyanamide hydratase